MGNSAYGELDLATPCKQATMSSLPDTGAHMMVAGPDQMYQMVVTKRKLIPLSPMDITCLGLLVIPRKDSRSRAGPPAMLQC